MSHSKICLQIADLYFHLHTDHHAFLEELANKYKPFLTKSTPQNPCQIRMTHHNFSHGSDDIETEDQGGCYHLRGENFTSNLKLKHKTAEVAIRPEISTFDMFFRVLCSLILPHFHGFLIHALGLKAGEEGYLFSGPSESGKSSTALRAEHDFQILSDELIIVRRNKNGFFLYSSPFHGDYEKQIANVSAKLKTIFFLNKNIVQKKGFHRQSQLETMLQLLENIFLFNPGLESHQKVLNLCRKLSIENEGFQMNTFSRPTLRSLIHETERNNTFTT